MENNKKKEEELQSRREFFKKVGKGVLPILGAAVLSALPVEETKAQINPYDCNGYSCVSNCHGSCNRSCHLNCDNSCKRSCEWNCSALNANSRY